MKTSTACHRNLSCQPARFTGWALTGLALCISCMQQPDHNLGQTQEPVVAVEETYESTEPEGVLAELPEGTLPADSLADFAGTWVGTAEMALSVSPEGQPAERYSFPSGATEIYLTIAQERDPEFSTFGSLRFGQDEPPPPAVDPDLGYPPDPNYRATGQFADRMLPPVQEGMSYSLRRAGAGYSDLSLLGDESDLVSFLSMSIPEVFDNRLELTFRTTELFASWCALQTEESCITPFASNGVSFDDDGSNCIAGNGDAVDCQKADLCMADRCECSGDFCMANRQQPPHTLRMRRTSDGLVGLVLGGVDVFLNRSGFRAPIGQIHFRRVESETP